MGKLSLESYMDAYAERWHFQGAVLVVRRGNVLLRRGYGLAVAEHGVPNKPETKFGIASLSKGFTAIAVLQLMEQGLLSLEDPVERYLPGLLNDSKITIEHLLRHTSGIPDFFAMSDFWTKRQRLPHSIGEAVNLIKDMPLLFEPGARFAYSNGGYTLLAAVIESCTGLSYSTYMESAVFRPLALRGTGVCDSRTIVPDMAAGYSICRGPVRAEPIDMTVAVGGFGLYSTVDDLYRWVRGIEKLVSRETASLIFQPSLNGFYGYGWFLGKSAIGGNERRKVWHDGGVSGFNSRLNHYPDEELTVVILSNNNITPAGTIADRLAAIAFGEEVQAVEPIQTVRIPEEQLERFEGIYVTDDQSMPTEDQEREGMELFRRLNITDFGVGTFLRVFEHLGLEPLRTVIVSKEGERLYLFRPTGGFSFLLELIPERKGDNEFVFTSKYQEEHYRFRFTGSQNISHTRKMIIECSCLSGRRNLLELRRKSGESSFAEMESV